MASQSTDETTLGSRVGETPDFQQVFEAAPFLQLILDTSFTIVAVSDAHAEATLTSRDKSIGRYLFEVFPDNPADSGADGVSNLRRSLLTVLKTRKSDLMQIQQYDVPKPAGDGFERRYWRILNTPLLGTDGYVRWILNSVEDVTELVTLRERDR